MQVDLNADVGEDDSVENPDRLILGQVTSANVACGLHVGTPALMRRTIEVARGCGVAVGAHPSFHDREGFGRREMHLSSDEVERLIVTQLETLAGVALACGVTLHHVKPHGALYNMAAREPWLALAIARAVRQFDPNLILVGLSGSALITAALDEGLAAAHEAFADRGYRSDGSLVPRGQSGAVLSDRAVVVTQATRMVSDGIVRAVTGEVVHLKVDTICIHGDTPGAAAMAADLRAAFGRNGIEVRALEVA